VSCASPPTISTSCCQRNRRIIESERLTKSYPSLSVHLASLVFFVDDVALVLFLEGVLQVNCAVLISLVINMICLSVRPIT
jgi:hypothetical protein